MAAVQKTTLHLPRDLHTQAKIEAAKLRISLTELVVRALQREIDRLKAEQVPEDKNGLQG